MSQLKDSSSLKLSSVQNVRELTERAARLWGDKVGVIFDEFDEKLTFADIHKKSNRIAVALTNLGVKKGDRVGIMLRNQKEFPLTWLALGKLGAIMVPINIYYKEFDAQYIVEHSGLHTVVTSREFVPLLETIQSKQQLEIISVDSSSNSRLKNLYEILPNTNVYLPEEALYPETVMNIQYTSGTTGRPKGCVLTHSYWMRFGTECVENPQLELDESDIILTSQPFYYMDPQWNVIAALASGATLVVLDRFHPSTFWEKVREYHVTFFYCLGVMPVLMLKIPESAHDKKNSVKRIACSAIPVHLHKELEERWGAPWFELFGMTETGLDIMVTKEEQRELVGSGCIGRPINHREIRIVDESDRVVPRGQVGELTLRGTGLMDRYYKNKEATDEAFRGGWFHTGDLVYMDDKGLIYYVGRKKEMIRRSGENISSTEVEDAIKLHPEVSYVAALPVPDDIRGEEAKAYIVLRDENANHDEVLKSIIKHCEEQLAYFKIPRYWEFKNDLPKTPSEKIEKHKLRNEKEDLRLDSYDRIDKVWRI